MDKEIIEQAIGELKTAENSCADSYAHGNILRAIELLESAKAEQQDYSKCPYCGATRVVRPSGEWQFYCYCYDPEKRPKAEPVCPNCKKRGEQAKEPHTCKKAEQPEAGEFTNKVRNQEDVWKELPQDSITEWLAQNLLEACDRLDAQQQEIERLKRDVWQTIPNEDGEGGLKWIQMATDLDMQRMNLTAERNRLLTELTTANDIASNRREEIDRLTAENKCLKDKLEDWENREGAICPEDVGFEEYIKAQAERIVELEKRPDFTKGEHDVSKFYRDEALQQQEGKTENPG